MVKKTTIIRGIASFGLMFGLASGSAIAQMPHDMNEMPSAQTEQTGQFRRIEQPLGYRVAVTLGGLGLIGLELWWFLLSKPKSRQAALQENFRRGGSTPD